MKKRRKDYSRLIYAAAGAVFIVCACFLLYPFVSDLSKQHTNDKIIQEYHDKTKDFDKTQYDSLMQEAVDYNNKLADTVDYVVNDYEYKKSDEYESVLDPDGTGLIGYIEIPSINVREPIYHYSTESVLEKGIGHIHGSSFPIASGSSHAVLTGHRGLLDQKLFTDLDKVKEGDKFYIHVLNDVFAYEVDSIQTVLPEESQSLRIEQGKDLVTLVTCTPYGVNSHRLLVTGHNIPFSEDKVDKASGLVVDTGERHITIDPCLLAFLGVMAVILIYAAVDAGKRKHRNKRGKYEDKKTHRSVTGSNSHRPRAERSNGGRTGKPSGRVKPHAGNRRESGSVSDRKLRR